VPTLWLEKALLGEEWAEGVAIEIEAGLIRSLVKSTLPPSDAERPAGIAVPGTTNLHSHAFQRAMAGLAERRGPEEDSFWSWREVMYRFLAILDPDDIEAIAEWAYVEMLEGGFTSVGEFHYVHNAPDGQRYADPAETGGRIVAAAATAGIGLALLPTFYAHGGCGGQPSAEGQRRFLSDLDGFQRLLEASRRHLSRLEGAVLGISPHSLRAVTEAELRSLLAMHSSGPVHIHAAEQTREVEECLAWSGARPVEWLLDHMPLDPRWCLIHATHMTPEECDRLARSGATAGLCPITEANLGDGIFEATRFVECGGRLGVGSDSNLRISLAEELRTLEHSQRLRDRMRSRLCPRGGSTGRFLLQAAAAGGAQALGLATGRIAEGLRADIVVLDPDHPALVGRSGDAMLDAWVFAAGDGAVRDVWVAGRHVVANGRHRDRERLRKRFGEVAKRLAAAI
jgi:formiminoglutamate deiminase